MLPSAGHSWRGYLVAVCVASGMLLLTVAVPFLNDHAPLTLPLTAVVISAWYAGLGPGLVATLIGGLGLALFVFPPYFSPLTSADDAVRLALYFGSSVVIAILSEARLWALRQAAYSQLAAEAAAKRASQMQALTAALSDATTPQQVADVVVTYGLAAAGAKAGGVGAVSRDRTRLETLRRFGYPADQPDPPPLPLDQLGVPGEALASGQPIFLTSQVELAQRYPHRVDALTPMTDGVLAALPLVVEGRVIGVLDARYDAVHNFDAGETAHLVSIAQQCGQALQRVWLAEDERAATRAVVQAAERMRRLQEVTAALSQAVTLDEVIDAIVNHALVAVGATGAALAHLVPERNEFELLRMVGYADDVRQAYASYIADAAVPGAEAVRQRRALLYESRAALVADYPHLAPLLDDYGAWAILPLLTASGVFGSLSFSFDQPRAFTPNERAFLATLAEQCAQALERARLYEAEQHARAQAEEARRRVEIVAQINAVLASSLDFRSRLEQLVHLVIPTLGDGCVVYILDDQGHLQPSAAAHVNPATDRRIRVALRDVPGYLAQMGPAGGMFSAGQPLVMSPIDPATLDGGDDPESAALARDVGLSSFMAVPLMAFGRFLGSMTLFITESDRVYTPADVTLAEEVTRRAAVALENARLFEEEQRARATAETARRRVEFIAQINTILLEALEFDASLMRLAEQVTPVLGDGCILHALEPDGTLRLVAVSHVDPTTEDILRQLLAFYPGEMEAQSAVEAVLRQNHSFVVSPLGPPMLAALAPGPAAMGLMRALRPTSIIIAPLVAFGRRLGMMTLLITDSDRLYSAEDVALAEEVARRAAIAVDNARLYDKEREARAAAEAAAERVRRLQGVTAALSGAVTRDEVADVIIREGMRAFNAEGAVLNMLTPDGQMFELVRNVGYPPQVMQHWRRYPATIRAPVPDAVRERQILLLESSTVAAARYPDLVGHHSGFQAWAIVPLLRGEQAVGALGFDFTAPRTFSEEDVALLKTLGDQCVQALERARLYEEEQAARERSEAARQRIEFVAQVNATLSLSMDYRTRVERLAEQLVPALGDGCIVHVARDGGDLEAIAFAPGAAEDSGDLAHYLGDHVIADDPAHPMRQRLAAGDTVLIPDMAEPDLMARLPDAPRGAVVRDLAAGALMIVPLVAFGRFLGAVTLYTTQAERRLSPQDVAMAEEVMRRAAVALDNARLYELEREAHAAAEQAASRVRRLQAVTAALSQAATLDEVADVIIHAGTTSLDATGGALALVTPNGNDIEIVRAHGYPPEVVNRFRRFLLITATPIADAVRTREIIVVGSPAAAATRYPDIVDAQSGFQAWVTVPLVTADHALGAIDIAFATPRIFSAEEEIFLHTLGEQCAQAVERARLYDAEQEARAVADTVARRISLLYDASSRLAESLDLKEVLETLARLMVPAVADWCVIDMVTTGHWAKQFFVTHVDPEKEVLAREMTRRYPPQPSYALGLNQVLENARPLFIPEVTPEMLAQRTKNAAHLAMIQQIRPTTYTIQPLVARGQLLGTMSLAMTEGRRFEPADLEVAQELARRAAVFVDNARLYQETRDAMAARQAILAVVSHDLKNPLAVIKGYAALMDRAARHLDEPTRQRISDRVRRIDAVTMRMNSMIEELADFSRIQVGQPLDLEMESADLVQLVRQVVEEQRQTTKSHQIELHSDTPRRLIDMDTVKMARVLTNIIGNAIKYSPEGGRIDVRVSVETRFGDQWAVISITDEGVGIPAEDMPNIFDFYRRGSNIAGRVKGAGIGLATADYVVKQHGGRIEVTSEVGGGSTFVVHLPLRNP